MNSQKTTNPLYSMTQAILDTHEFDRLYSEYKSRFIVIAYALLRDKTLAEDLVTDSFLLLWEKRREIQLSQDEFPAYILGIVRHKCIDALRERQTHLQIQHQMYLRGMRNIRTSLGLLEDCDLSKVLFIRMSRKYSGGVWPKCPNYRRRFSLPIVSRIKPISRLPSATTYRYARSHAKSSDACICYAKTWATTCQW